MLPGMKGITQTPSKCCDCGRDLPVPRRSNKKRCDECSHKRDRKRTGRWYAAHSQAAAKIHCEFRGGANLPEKYREKYRPTSPCLGEFDRKNPREKYCDNCKPVARRWQQLKAALAKYHADEKKAAKRALKNRLKRRKAQGQPVRIVLGRLYACAYRKNRKRGEGCLGTFRATSSAQKFCAVCQKHADADRAQKYREDHRDKLLPKYRARGKRLRELAAHGKRFEDGELVRARPIDEIGKARIALAACLRLDSIKAYAMKDHLSPLQSTNDTRDRQFDRTKKFLKDQKERIDLEMRRLDGLPKEERDKIAGEMRQFIHNFHRYP
jgi:hypothetical protein